MTDTDDTARWFWDNDWYRLEFPPGTKPPGRQDLPVADQDGHDPAQQNAGQPED